jgi:hypothetical protein
MEVLYIMNNEIKQSMSALSFSETTEKLKQDKIKYLLAQLDECKALIRSLQKKNTSSLSEPELFHLTRTLDLQVRKKKVLCAKLSALGYITDRRGRPKKNINDRYKSNHIRMACYFTPQNIQDIKILKEENSIANVSSFLNELIAVYFSATKDGVIND